MTAPRPHPLDPYNGVMHTAVGACWPGSHAIFRGHDLHRELADSDWLGLYVLGLLGRPCSEAEIRLLHGMCCVSSYPDSRLWNNRIGALAATTHSSPMLGLAAGIAATEAGIYGGGPGVRANGFFHRAGAAVHAGQDIADFVHAEMRVRRIYGYGRPINSHDERLPSLRALAESLGFADGLHYRLAFAVEEILLRDYRPSLKLNFAGLTAALGVDLGFNARQYQLFNSLKTMAGIPPCILEAGEKPVGAIYPLTCAQVNYTGVAPRPWLVGEGSAEGRE